MDFAQVLPFDLRIVKIVQVIKGPDAVAVAQEPFANVRADETRAAGDQKIHGRKLTVGGRSVERQENSPTIWRACRWSCPRSNKRRSVETE